jgi:hypothetical protein
MGRASVRPVNRQHDTQLIAVDRPTPKRRADALAVDPSSTVKIKRFLKSFDKARPIHTDLLTVIRLKHISTNLGIPF